MRVHESCGVRIQKLEDSIYDHVEKPEIATWLAKYSDKTFDDFLKEEIAALESKLDAGLAPAESIALQRGKLEHLFGPPNSRGDDYKSSFNYELLAHVEGRPVYFTISDRKIWGTYLRFEFSTSGAADRRVVERAFWALLADAPLADFSDHFEWDEFGDKEIASAEYGVRDGKPWANIVLSGR